jgi:hypothetical protein
MQCLAIMRILVLFFLSSATFAKHPSSSPTFVSSYKEILTQTVKDLLSFHQDLAKNKAVLRASFEEQLAGFDMAMSNLAEVKLNWVVSKCEATPMQHEPNLVFQVIEEVVDRDMMEQCRKLEVERWRLAGVMQMHFNTIQEQAVQYNKYLDKSSAKFEALKTDFFARVEQLKLGDLDEDVYRTVIEMLAWERQGEGLERISTV